MAELISFTVNGEELIARVDSRTMVERPVFSLKMKCASPAEALIYSGHFQRILEKEMANIRMKAYWQGHEHATRNRRTFTTFDSSCDQSADVGMK